MNKTSIPLRSLLLRLMPLSLLFFVASSLAQQELHIYKWSELKDKGWMPPGEIISPKDQNSFEQLRVEHTVETSATLLILTIDKPVITQSSYALTGQVKYEDVAEKGYLEMWSHFPEGKRYFSRTLASSGPLMQLEGSSNWRPFSLPFQIGSETDIRPVKLEVNVHLPQGGTVYLSPLKLVQYESRQQLERAMHSHGWWTPRSAGMIGGIGGSVVGLVGALVGIFTSIGKFRRFVLSLMIVWLVSGVICLVIGVVAFLSDQPYAVYYPLLLFGFLGTLLPACLYRGVRKRYEENELRKMTARDVT